MTAERPVAVALENRLMSHGIYVTGVAPADESATDASSPANEPRPADGAGLALEYETVAGAPSVTSDEVGAVVRTLLSIAEEREWTPGRLEATSRTTDGELRGRWHVDADWFDALGADLSQVEFSERVLNTVRTARIDD